MLSFASIIENNRDTIDFTGPGKKRKSPLAMKCDRTGIDHIILMVLLRRQK